MKSTPPALLILLVLAGPASALERPWISDVFFYWYTWDYDTELGSWLGGIHNTPLDGYYDSRTFRDNRRSLWQASEWGMTHHFMDYWSPDWKGEDGQMREAVVMRAAEALREAGYGIWMAYYQDGTNFEMREFSRNVSENRDVHQWLRDFARSPAWPKIGGEPIQLVYSRNGRPKTTIDHEGFRRFLKERYGDVGSLNKAWQTEFHSFDEIEMTFAVAGHQRAESIEYQYRIWRQEWQKLNGLIEQELGMPGMRASFDVGYGPYDGFGFAGFVRVFGGPHSYGGIFGPPHEQDAQRFIQAALAKKYGTVFFDHFKNYYFDWDIRVPGTAYLPDPFHFDRFWVGALARHSEALLHLSWNEWWEGSNLEPCREFGKTYCEKNLFYSTVMQLAFESIRTAGQKAPVAVLLNDWRFASGGPHEEELYGTIQILRRLGVPFDLVPDDLVTAEGLERFRLVIAPAYGCGLGYDKHREPILDVLHRWLSGGDRRLIISGHPSVAAKLGLRESEAQQAEPGVKGDDLNVFIDVGAEGDDEFLRSGYSGRETGMRFGDDVTFRWTPARGRETSLILPASPNRDHVLRLRGSAIWPNELSVVVNGREVGTFPVPAGAVSLDAQVPAAAIDNSPMVSLRLQYTGANVPGDKAPRQYPGEQRVCNLSLNWLQWSTASVPAASQEQKYTVIGDTVFLGDEMFAAGPDEEVPVSFRARPNLTAPGATVLSALRIGKIPRDLELPAGPSRVLYVNGPLSEVETEGYWLPLVRRWAGVDFRRPAVGQHCMAAPLSAGDTQFIVCFNEDIQAPVQLDLVLPAGDLPLSETAVLSRDGRSHEQLAAVSDKATHKAHDTLRYYGVYQFAFSLVRIKTPDLVLQPGQSRGFPVEVTNLTKRPVRGQIRLASVIPTLSGEPEQIELEPGEKRTITVRVNAAPTVDWGKKTVYFELVFGGRRAVVLRELTVQKPVEVELADVVLDAARPQLELQVPENPYGQTASLVGARLTLRGHTVEVPEVEEGSRSLVTLPALELPAPPQPVLEAERLRIDAPGIQPRQVIEREAFLARKPEAYPRQPDATAVLAVFNPRSTPLEHELVSVEMSVGVGKHSIRTEQGAAVPSQLDAGGRLMFLADVPARSARIFFLSPTEAEVATDLRCTVQDLGSGHGALRVENSHWSLTLSEAAGGTATSLQSVRTGRDYGRGSFGINYGTFSRHDPAQPRTNTVEYIRESKTRQKDSPGRIELVAGGPAGAIARVTWADDKVRVQQTYQFPAYNPYLVIRQTVRPIALGDQQELVALDASFQPHGFTKAFPNFVGVVNDREQPHFGWRQGSWVPDYATLMAPHDFDESISLVITRKVGLTGIRQGFWPAERPKPGKCEIARVELLADTAAGCDTDVYVLLHDGHQIMAKRFLAEMNLRPRVDVVHEPRWIEEVWSQEDSN